jgi:hypothetical protein
LKKELSKQVGSAAGDLPNQVPAIYTTSGLVTSSGNNITIGHFLPCNHVWDVLRLHARELSYARQCSHRQCSHPLGKTCLRRLKSKTVTREISENAQAQELVEVCIDRVARAHMVREICVHQHNKLSRRKFETMSVSGACKMVVHCWLYRKRWGMKLSPDHSGSKYNGDRKYARNCIFQQVGHTETKLSFPRSKNLHSDQLNIICPRIFQRCGAGLLHCCRNCTT